MSMLKLSVLAGLAGAAFVPLPFLGAGQQQQQQPLGSEVQTSKFKCDLPPAIDPAGDGFPSAEDLFSSDDALAKQIERHQAIVRVPSICFDDLGDVEEDPRYAVFHTLHEVLAETYPNIHKRSKIEKINTLGLLFTLEGSDPSLKPTMLTAHQDVVPVADASTWTHPPFNATWDGEWLWGRGSSDDKNSMTALMSATETLLGADVDWTPRRTLLLAFGFDEECSGFKGAGSIGQVLTERYGDGGVGIIVDEGGLGLAEMGGALYALPGVTEKGHVDIWFELHVQGGHSSVPFPHTGIGIIAEMVSTLEAHPYDAQLIPDSPVFRHLSCVARWSPGAWPEVTRPLEKGDLDAVAAELVSGSRPTHFSIQTSQSVDFIAGGQKINAMPEMVTLGVNYRVSPQDGVLKVQHRAVSLIQDVVDKYNITVRAYEGDEDYAAYVAGLGLQDQPAEPLYDVDYDGNLIITAKQISQVAPISLTDGEVWDIFSGTIQHTFKMDDGPTVPVGETMTGNTDTRHYLNLTPNVYRWSPVKAGTSEGVHTTNERVLMSWHMEMIKFYYNFIRNFDAADLP